MDKIKDVLTPPPVILRSRGKPQHVVLQYDQYSRLVGLARRRGTANASASGTGRREKGYVALPELGRMLAGKWISDARKKSGMSQAALGKKVGMPQSQISRTERNPEQCTVRTLRKLAQALNVDVATFLQQDE
jgi:ribosome-binding protein aMBF1 (putative translation factor)